jgi:uncharacterized membrane protein
VTALVTIALAALVTWACRLGGWIVIARLSPGPLLTAWLQQLPGAVLAALIAPMVVAAGPPGWLAAAAGFLVMRATGAFLAAMAAGLALYVLLGRLFS